MYTVAGSAAEAMGGQRWEQLLREEILLPLNMTRTEVFNPQPAPEDKYARSYIQNSEGERVSVPFENYSG